MRIGIYKIISKESEKITVVMIIRSKKMALPTVKPLWMDHWMRHAPADKDEITFHHQMGQEEYRTSMIAVKCNTGNLSPYMEFHCLTIG